MTTNLLYLGNGPQLHSPAKLDERFRSWGLNVDLRWAYGGDFPPILEGYDGIFLSGSPHGAYEDEDFILREHDLIMDAAGIGIPMLGICFGSQILASALCGREQVFRRSSCEVGFKALPLLPPAREDRICADLGESVTMFVWHNDEVRHDHSDMTVIARSDLCPNQIWRWRDNPIWGIQGHPEFTKVQAAIWFEEIRNRLERDGADVDALKRDALEAADAKTMIRQFATLVADGT